MVINLALLLGEIAEFLLKHTSVKTKLSTLKCQQNGSLFSMYEGQPINEGHPINSETCFVFDNPTEFLKNP